MLPLDVFHSVEFYVILTVVAAAILAFCARPSQRGEAETHLLAGVLSDAPDTENPSITVECLENGDVTITRHGLRGIYSTGAASLAITQIGTDLKIIERLTPGPRPYPATDDDGNVQAPADIVEALFTLNFMGRGWYHIKYEAEGNFFAAFSLHVRPGITIQRSLVQ